MPTGRITQEYFSHGLSYYISARHAALAGFGFSPVCGLLAHYAIEMFLKSRLSVTMTEDELRNRISHNLEKAWNVFKSEYPAVKLSPFDGTISQIQRFWNVRYPEKILKLGMSCSVDFSGLSGYRQPKAITHTPNTKQAPTYHLSLHDLDILVRALFDACSINPAFFISGMRDHAKQYLFLNNQYFTPENIDATKLCTTVM